MWKEPGFPDILWKAHLMTRNSGTGRSHKLWINVSDVKSFKIMDLSCYSSWCYPNLYTYTFWGSGFSARSSGRLWARKEIISGKKWTRGILRPVKKCQKCCFSGQGDYNDCRIWSLGFAGYSLRQISFFGEGAPAAYSVSQAKGRIRAVAEGLRARSELRLQPTPQLVAMPDP